jgi:antitoxin ChpS
VNTRGIPPSLSRASFVQEARLTEDFWEILYYKITMETGMHTTNLRKVGGSVMLAIPPALLDILCLEPGAKVGMAVESGRLIIHPQKRRSYTLDELLAQCNPKARRSKEEGEWLRDKRVVGGELI